MTTFSVNSALHGFCALVQVVEERNLDSKWKILKVFCFNSNFLLFSDVFRVPLSFPQPLPN